jgi:hypothetical protein
VFVGFNLGGRLPLISKQVFLARVLNSFPTLITLFSKLFFDGDYWICAFRDVLDKEQFNKSSKLKVVPGN